MRVFQSSNNLTRKSCDMAMRNPLSRLLKWLFALLVLVYLLHKLSFMPRFRTILRSAMTLNVYQAIDPSTYSDVYPEDPHPRIKEIAELMTKWYQLLIDMRYIRAENVAFPPHKHLKLNIAKPAAYGFVKDVVDLYQLLPYHTAEPEWNFGSDHGEFLMWGEFLEDLRVPDADWWQWVVDPFYALDDLSQHFEQGILANESIIKGWNDANGPYIRPWYAPLNQVGNHGSVMVLDTKKYRMWLVGQQDGPGSTQDPALQGLPFKPSGSENIFDLDQYPSRPAVEFLIDMISRFQALEWIPGGLYDSNTMPGSEEDVDYYSNYKTLYKDCGWPDKFDPILFDKLRLEGGTKFSFWESSPDNSEEEKSFAALKHLEMIMANAREIVQQQIHLVDATYRLQNNLYSDKWEEQKLQGQLMGTESILKPMKTWKEDQAKLQVELDFRLADLECLRTRTGRYAGPGWSGVSDVEIRRLYVAAAADDRIGEIQSLLKDDDSDERAERVYYEAKQAARETDQDVWDAKAKADHVWENDEWKDRWSILGSGTAVVDLRTVVDQDLSWSELQRRIVYELEKNEDRSWEGKRLWRNNGGQVATVLH